MTTSLTASAAARQIVADINPLSVHCIPLLEALDRVLAVDVHSRMDVPAWDNSAMDGYAVRSNDLRKRAARAGAPAAHVELRVVETIPAGKFPTRPLRPGCPSSPASRRTRSRTCATIGCSSGTASRQRSGGRRSYRSAGAVCGQG